MKKLILIPLVLWGVCLCGQTLKEKTNTVTVDYSDPVPSKSDRKYRALIMGVSKYQYEDARLQSLDRPASDAQQIYDLITQLYTFEPADVILLKDPRDMILLKRWTSSHS